MRNPGNYLERVAQAGQPVSILRKLNNVCLGQTAT
jgi:hypothetical protein